MPDTAIPGLPAPVAMLAAFWPTMLTWAARVTAIPSAVERNTMRCLLASVPRSVTADCRVQRGCAAVPPVAEEAQPAVLATYRVSASVAQRPS